MRTNALMLRKTQQRKSSRFTLLLAGASLTLLMGCEKVIVERCDVPVVRANQCVKDNLKEANLAPCTLDYLDLVGKQQKAIKAINGE